MANNNQDIKAVAEQSRIKPPHGAWGKLEDKLDADLKLAERKKRKLFSGLINIAAAFAILIVCVFIYQETQQDLEVSKGNIAEWEELGTPLDNHYNITRIHSLTEAYKS